MGKVRGKKDVKPVIIESLENGATVSAACAGADINRNTFYKWYEQDPEFAKQVDAAQKSRVHHVEDSLYKKAMAGNLTAIIFYLCNRAPDKWKNVQKVEASLNGQGPLHFVLYDPDKHAQPSEPGKAA